MKRLALLLAPFVVLFGLLLDVACGHPVTQKDVQSVTTGVFTAEDVVCMVTGLLGPYTMGTPAEVVSDILAACKIAPQLTQDVQNFVDAFVPPAPDAGPALSSVEDARWRAYAMEKAAHLSK